jgi:PadR family transcriptional regulator PadR
MASVIHTGPFSALEPAYAAMFRWLEANGCQITAPPCNPLPRAAVRTNFPDDHTVYLTILCDIQYIDTVRRTALEGIQHMSDTDEQISQLRLELRRGIVVLAVLSQLDTARYGYSLIQQLAEQGLEIEEGTLYPLLRRLEKQGLLESEWEVGEARPRKYYRISPAGRDVLAMLIAEWNATVRVMHNILKGDNNG